MAAITLDGQLQSATEGDMALWQAFLAWMKEREAAMDQYADACANHEQAIRHAVAVGIKAAHCCWMREGQECHPIDHPNVNPKDLCQGCRKAWDALTGHSGETVPKEAQ